MYRLHALHTRLACCLVAVLLAALFSGCSVTQNKWTDPDRSQALTEMIKSNKYAYLRYSQAEEDARREGNAQAAAEYHKAKEKALAEYQRYEKELADFEAHRGIRTTP